MTKLTFEKYSVKLDDDSKDVTVFCNQDTTNQPAAYNTKKRPYKKIKQMFLDLHALGDRSTFSTVVMACQDCGASMRSWCMVD